VYIKHLEYTITIQMCVKRITLTKYTGFGKVESKVSEISNLIENAKSTDLFVLFDPKFIEIKDMEERNKMLNQGFNYDEYIAFATINNRNKKFYITKCNVKTLICENYKEESIDIKADTLVITNQGFYVTYNNPVNFMKIGFDGIPTIESFLYFTRGVKQIHFFKDTFLGQTEDSLYEL
jgi:hypothetical protein